MGRALVIATVLVLSTLFPFLSAQAKNETVIAVMGVDGVQKAAIIAGAHYFSPNRIVVKAGVPVELRVKTEKTSKEHGFVLIAPEAGLDISVPIGGDARIISFTPTKRGEYRFYCDRKSFLVGTHRGKGMEGVLVVI